MLHKIRKNKFNFNPEKLQSQQHTITDQSSQFIALEKTIAVSSHQLTEINNLCQHAQEKISELEKQNSLLLKKIELAKKSSPAPSATDYS